MSQFYARYVPSSNAQAQTESTKPAAEKKRKHDDHATNLEKSRKKRKAVPDERLSNTHTASKTSDHSHDVERKDTTEVNGAQKLLKKYSATAQAYSGQDASMRGRRSAPAQAVSDTKETELQSSQRETELKPREKKKKKEEKQEPEVNGINEPVQNNGVLHDPKHQKVLAKFTRSTEKINEDLEQSIDGNEAAKTTPVKLHGLEQIPQPAPVEIPHLKPTYSTLPAWQEEATRIPPHQGTRFEDLGLSKLVLDNLKSQGFEQAFPVQSAVVPLLTEGPNRYQGDLCVSATTGSGKTLSYVLPIIEAIKFVGITRLGAVIVVPTRELVKQVRQICDICSTGTELRIATAVGSKSMKEEQDALVLTQQVHDPDAYQKEKDAATKWDKVPKTSQFSSDARSTPKDHVIRYLSKVDILICTPGRLVDHLRSTPGFSLSYVKWLVIDEADRLLNESYQEWVDEVVPALQSTEATRQRDDVLRSVRSDVPRREVQKVLLSATMTQDISKLNSIGLFKPKLLVLGGSINKQDLTASAHRNSADNEDLVPDLTGLFHLPLSLAETAVLVKDGADKPLHLLELLTKHAGIPGNPLIKHQSSPGHITQQESETSDSDATSSSGSDSDSDSESSQTSESDSPDASALEHPASRALIFTRSTASAERLSRLLALLSPALSSSISTLTRSTTSSASSRRAFASFRSGKTSILIATDRASRGLDVPDLEHVISYDVPNSVSSYVHRVGRTARAGKEGRAWTFVEHREGKWFWEEIGGRRKDGQEPKISRNGKVAKMTLDIEDEGLRSKYVEALQRLGDEVQEK